MTDLRPSFSLRPPAVLFGALKNAAVPRPHTAPTATSTAPTPATPRPPAPARDHMQAPPMQASANSQLQFVNTPKIGPDDKVLHIGDSHTVGIYGQEMDKHLRKTGAQVATYGSAGSSPKWWMTGQTTRSGFFSRDAEEKTTRPAKWNDPHPTPKLKNLLEEFRPNVVVFSLGANLIGANPSTIESQMREIADLAKSYGTEIIWVGPPDGRESKKPTSKQSELYETLSRVARDYGSFIDSRPLTEYPKTGGDGVHYWGKEGTRIAKAWAEDVFDQIQSLNTP